MNKILSLLLLASTVALSHASYSCETYCGYSAVKNASVAPAGSVNRTSYFFDDGQFPPSVYDAQDGVCGLQVYVNDKTITITGVVYAYNDPSTGFFMNIQGNINNAQTGGHLELSSSSYKANGGPIDPSTWYFYSLSSGALTGFGAYQGVFIALQESMAPLQVGVGANGKNYNLGLSAWFAYNISGKIYSSDINIDLVCKEQTCFPAWNITGALDYAVTFRSTSGVLTKYNFIDPTGILVEDATLSSAVVGGQIRNVDGTGETCTFALLLVRDKSYNMPHEELPSSAYKANGGPIDPSTWRYYALVSGSVTCPSYYISLATYEGMDLQIGVGANDKNYNFGASGWFEYNNATGNVSGVMDINVDLICGPLAPTPAPPTPAPTPVPTSVPTATPTSVPTSVPTAAPTVAPTAVPTSVPTSAPTPVATSVPTAAPTVVPTPTPTLAPCSVTVTATYIPGTAGFIVVNGQNVINANYELSVVSHASETVTSVDITFAPYSGSYVTNASSNLVPTSTGITNEYILNTQLTSGNTDSSATISTIFAATGYAPNIPIASAVAQCGAVTSAPTPAPTSASATGASGTTTGSETTGSSGSSASTTGSSATGSSTTSGSYTCPPNPYVAEQAIADQYGGYSYFSVIFNDTGINQQWRFNFENNAGTFIINENDGTAALYGILVPESSNPNDGLFDFQISLYIGFNPGSVPATPFEELNPDAYVPNGPVDPATWKYFTYANSSSTPIGATGYALNIVPFMDMQFQVGAGANGKNINFGAASWFSFYLVNSANTLVSSGKADVNVDLVCQPSSSSEATGTTGATDSSATSSVGTTQVGAQQTSPPAPTAAATTAGAATVTYSMMLAFFVTIVLNFV